MKEDFEIRTGIIGNVLYYVSKGKKYTGVIVHLPDDCIRLAIEGHHSLRPAQEASITYESIRFSRLLGFMAGVKGLRRITKFQSGSVSLYAVQSNYTPI
ncbi:MAG: hypothetical protein HYW23_03305 [Candidatus Aenigmarchaeota archaeon]|nr:hypothetical protein [Candidatus Aenigmarchaeota archaeon]